MAFLTRERGYGRLAKPQRMENMEQVQQEIDQKLCRPAQLLFFKYFVKQIGMFLQNLLNPY
jgi:hypothetical protein